MKKLEPGQEITAEIVAITNDCIFIDLNEKSEGVLDRAELNNDKGECTVKEGEKIKVFFLGDKGGEMRFTTKISGDKANATMLENAYKNGIPVDGFVEKEIKGGYEVKIGSSRAFCPYSQMGFRQKDSAEKFIGKTLTFRIQEFKENGKNILVSNRAILEDEHKSQLEVLQNKLKVGMKVTGTIISIQNYGAFVDINGFQALLPVSEVARNRIDDLSEVLTVGQTVTVEIIRTDWDKERVSVSMKTLQADPWDNAAEKYHVESKHSGSISRVLDYGLFVTLEPGIDGLVHISEITEENHNTNLRVKYKVGQAFDVEVISVDMDKKRIGLKPASSKEQDETAKKYLGNQEDDGDTYNPFAALLKK